MTKVVGVRFRQVGKIYFFAPGKYSVETGQHVIVETARGVEYGQVVLGEREVEDTAVIQPLKAIIRVATPEDDERELKDREKEKEAFKIAQEKIKKYKLDMNLTEVEYKFDNSKIIFFFTADGRIDFRELVKDLAAVFRTRIELRQIGVRDEVKKIGGNGVCGRELCCCSFLDNFEAVSIKMAKEQNVSLNPSKISGNCGRLMCCLKYEQNVYEDKLKRLPKIGAIVKTEDGEGTVDSIQTLREIIRVKFRDGEDTFYKRYPASEVKIIKNIGREEIDPEEKEHAKELAELEKLEKLDERAKSDDDDI